MQLCTVCSREQDGTVDGVVDARVYAGKFWPCSTLPANLTMLITVP